jgi:hypothetical protein
MKIQLRPLTSNLIGDISAAVHQQRRAIALLQRSLV